MALSHSPSIITDGLVLYLDAANPRSYPGSGTTWTDLTGRGNNGTFVGGVSYNSGNNGNLVFNGSSGYIDLGTFFTYPSFTIITWVNAGSSQSGYADIFDNNHAGSYQNFVAQNDGSGNNYGFGVSFADNTGSGVSFSLTPNVWTCLTFTFTPSSAVIGYINGQFLAQGNSANNKNINYSNQFLRISRWGGGGRFWNGRISNFIVYSRVLSAAEVQQNFNALRGRFNI
jgi:hypothetical protein